jgi:PilZ domain
LILRLICPECEKDSYSASAEAFKPCPYCGIVFSGRFGREKRNEDRSSTDFNIGFSYKGKNLEASTVNISETGLSIKLTADQSLPVGDIMDLKVRDTHLKARIIWVSNTSSSFLTGLKILDGNLNLKS